MPVPIPQETDPFAEPGKWVFVNQQWIPIVLGTLSYALNDRYWTGSQDETSGVIQSVLKLIDGLGELLPPETVREVTRFIEEMDNDGDNDDCEGDEMANCGSNVRFNECDGTLEYKSSDGTWLPVPPLASDFPVGEIPDDVAPLPSGTVACAKATGLWDLTEKYFNAVIETAPTAILGYRIPATWWAELLAEPGLSVREVETAIILGAPDFQSEWTEAITWWSTNLEDIKALFICKAQDAMSKTANATDSDMAYYRAYSEWDTGLESLDLKLYALANGIPKDSAVKAQIKAYATKPDDFTCDCAGDEPAPPPLDGTEPPTEGCIKVYPGSLARANYYNETYVHPIADFRTPEHGEKISENTWKDEALGSNGGGSDVFALGQLYELAPGTRIKSVKWDWVLTAANAGDTYQHSVRSFADDAANAVVAADVMWVWDAGTANTITESFSGGAWIAPKYVHLSHFLSAPTGQTIRITVKNVQFFISPTDGGFEGWVSAGQELCD